MSWKQLNCITCASRFLSAQCLTSTASFSYVFISPALVDSCDCKVAPNQTYLKLTGRRRVIKEGISYILSWFSTLILRKLNWNNGKNLKKILFKSILFCIDNKWLLMNLKIKRYFYRGWIIFWKSECMAGLALLQQMKISL